MIPVICRDAEGFNDPEDAPFYVESLNALRRELQKQFRQNGFRHEKFHVLPDYLEHQDPDGVVKARWHVLTASSPNVSFFDSTGPIPLE